MLGMSLQQLTESFSKDFRPMPTSKRPDKPEDGLAFKTVSPSHSGSINRRGVSIRVYTIRIDENLCELMP